MLAHRNPWVDTILNLVIDSNTSTKNTTTRLLIIITIVNSSCFLFYNNTVVFSCIKSTRHIYRFCKSYYVYQRHMHVHTYTISSCASARTSFIQSSIDLCMHVDTYARLCTISQCSRLEDSRRKSLNSASLDTYA